MFMSCEFVLCFCPLSLFNVLCPVSLFNVLCPVSLFNVCVL